MSILHGGGGDYGSPGIAQNVFFPLLRDRVLEMATAKFKSSAIDRLRIGLAVPSCQSNFVAGTSRGEITRKDVAGTSGNG